MVGGVGVWDLKFKVAQNFARHKDPVPPTGPYSSSCITFRRITYLVGKDIFQEKWIFKCDICKIKFCPIIIDHVRSTREGNVFTGVILSIRERGTHPLAR